MAKCSDIYPTLHFSKIGPPLERLKGRVIREIIDLPPSELRLLSRVYIVTSFCDFKSTRRMCSEEFSLRYPGQAALVNRATFELISNYIFITSNIEVRYKLYLLSQHKFLKDRHEKYKRQYSGHSEFDAFLKQSEKWVVDFEAHANIKPKDLDQNRIVAFPTPGKLLWKNTGKKIVENPYDLPEEDYALLRHLYYWMYGDYSSQVHGSYGGIQLRFLPDLIELRGAITFPEEEGNVVLEKTSSDEIYRSSLFFLILLSEVLIKLSLNQYFAETIVIWRTIGEYFLEAKEIYELRYGDLLGNRKA